MSQLFVVSLVVVGEHAVRILDIFGVDDVATGYARQLASIGPVQRRRHWHERALRIDHFERGVRERKPLSRIGQYQRHRDGGEILARRFELRLAEVAAYQPRIEVASEFLQHSAVAAADLEDRRGAEGGDRGSEEPALLLRQRARPQQKLLVLR